MKPRHQYVERRELHIRVARGAALDAVHKLIESQARAGVDFEFGGGGPQVSKGGCRIPEGWFTVLRYAIHETAAYDEMTALLKSLKCRPVRR